MTRRGLRSALVDAFSPCARVLVIHWHHGGVMRHAVERHLHALENVLPRVAYLNAAWERPRWVGATEFDAVVLHNLLLGRRWHDDFASVRARLRWIRDAAPLRIALPQDEYDHSELLDEWLADLGVEVVFSNFADDRVDLLYPTLRGRARVRPALTGYIDESVAAAAAQRMIPLDDRPHDVVYRGTRLPYWFGSHGQLKHVLAGAVHEAASDLGLRADVSTREEDTIYGSAWIDFLMSGRAVVGVESGSSVLDRRGEIQRSIKALLAADPGLSFEEVDARMPPGWDSHAFFALSPRHLEAVVTKTCQVLIEGDYSGVLVPHRHYLPVKRDFSNLRPTLERLRDDAFVVAMAERAYEEIYLRGAHRYADFARQLEAELPASRPRSVRRRLAPLTLEVGRGVDRVARRLRRPS